MECAQGMRVGARGCGEVWRTQQVDGERELRGIRMAEERGSGSARGEMGREDGTIV